MPPQQEWIQKHGRKAGSCAQNANKEQVVKRALSPREAISPFSGTPAVLVACLPVWGQGVAHLKRFPDPILKALITRQGRGSNDSSGRAHASITPQLTRRGHVCGDKKRCFSVVPIKGRKSHRPLSPQSGCKSVFFFFFPRLCDRKRRRVPQGLHSEGLSGAPLSVSF